MSIIGAFFVLAGAMSQPPLIKPNVQIVLTTLVTGVRPATKGSRLSQGFAYIMYSTGIPVQYRTAVRSTAVRVTCGGAGTCSPGR